MSSIIRCVCCHSELTMPQYYKGLPYGYTCISKVDPTYKQQKVKYVNLPILKKEITGSRIEILVEYKGVKNWLVGYLGSNGKTTLGYLSDSSIDLQLTNNKGLLLPILKNTNLDFSAILKSKKHK